MTHDPLARVSRLLSEAGAAPHDVDALPVMRDDAIRSIGDALRARARSRKRRKLVGLVALAASVALVASAGIVASRYRSGDRSTSELGRVQEPNGALTAVVDGRSALIDEGVAVAEGTELRTPPNAEAKLAFTSGTQLVIGGGARLRLVEQTKKKRFALESGSLTAKVAKLGPDERFVVATSDAEIEVRGTQFRVSVATPDPACGGGTPTRLDVTEGVVVVRHTNGETTVRGGEHWPTCVEQVVSSPKTTPESAARVTAPAARPSEHVAATPPSTVPRIAPSGESPAASRLAEQNDLYDQAMREKRSGRTGSAVATLDRLLGTYPQGPLAENAMVERMRLLAASDRTRGASSAREYLRRYPQGFARAEAEALASGTR